MNSHVDGTRFNDANHRAELTGNCPESLDELLMRFGNEGLAIPVWTPHPFDDKFTAAMRTRLIFSSLVDADFLDTERHFDPEQDRR